jgi:hypothetical protein
MVLGYETQLHKMTVKQGQNTTVLYGRKTVFQEESAYRIET